MKMEKAIENTPMQRASAVRTLAQITIAWMCVEFSISLYAGIQAHSVALTAFGADSAIELLSAVVVFRRFTIGPALERRAARLSAILLYALAAYILISSLMSVLSVNFRPEPTLLGIVLLVATAIIMPLLGKAKSRLAAQTGSQALKADAAQSSICAYMSGIALAGVLLNTAFHIPWADSAVALFLLPFVFKEANEAFRGKACHC